MKPKLRNTLLLQVGFAKTQANKVILSVGVHMKRFLLGYPNYFFVIIGEQQVLNVLWGNIPVASDLNLIKKH